MISVAESGFAELPELIGTQDKTLLAFARKNLHRKTVMSRFPDDDASFEFILKTKKSSDDKTS